MNPVIWACAPIMGSTWTENSVTQRIVAKVTFISKSYKVGQQDVSRHLAGGDMEVAGDLVEGESPVHPAGVLVPLRLHLSRWHLRVESREAWLPEDVLTAHIIHTNLVRMNTCSWWYSSRRYWFSRWTWSYKLVGLESQITKKATSSK